MNVPSTSQASGDIVPSCQHITSGKALSSYNRICTECANQPSAIKQLILRVVNIHNASVCEEHKITSLHSDDLSKFSNQYPQITAMINEFVYASGMQVTEFHKLAFILGEYSLLTGLLEDPVIVDEETQTIFFQKFFIKHGTDSAVAKLYQLVNSERNMRRNTLYTVLNPSALETFEQALDVVSLEPINPKCTQSGYTDSSILYYYVIKVIPGYKIDSFCCQLGFSFAQVHTSLDSHKLNYENTYIELLGKFLCKCNGQDRDWINGRIIDALKRAEVSRLVGDFKRHLPESASSQLINQPEKPTAQGFSCIIL